MANNESTAYTNKCKSLHAHLNSFVNLIKNRVSSKDFDWDKHKTVLLRVLFDYVNIYLKVRYPNYAHSTVEDIIIAADNRDFKTLVSLLKKLLSEHASSLQSTLSTVSENLYHHLTYFEQYVYGKQVFRNYFSRLIRQNGRKISALEMLSYIRDLNIYANLDVAVLHTSNQVYMKCNYVDKVEFFSDKNILLTNNTYDLAVVPYFAHRISPYDYLKYYTDLLNKTRIAINAVAIGGYFVLCVPRLFLTAEIVSLLCSTMSEIYCQCDVANHAFILCKKGTVADVQSAITTFIKNCLNGVFAKDLPKMSFNYDPLKPAIRRGRIYMESDFEAFVVGGIAVNELIKVLNDGKKTVKMQPNLPLTLDQIGLVMASGCMNGLVDAGEMSHVVKGVIKQRRVDFEETDNIKRQLKSGKKTVYNISLRVLTPDGKTVDLI